jgi:hypothetical protein
LPLSVLCLEMMQTLAKLRMQACWICYGRRRDVASGVHLESRLPVRRSLSVLPDVLMECSVWHRGSTLAG